MGNTIDKARRWMIRKLGGYPDEPMPRFIKIQEVRRKTEHLRSKMILLEDLGEPDVEIIRNYLARNLSEQVTSRIRVRKELIPELGEIHFSTEIWVCFESEDEVP